MDALNYLKVLGFEVNPNFQYCDNIEDVIEYVAKWKDLRKDLNYETDGVVIKVNDFAMQKMLVKRLNLLDGP